MLHQLKRLPNDILHINLYIDSPSLEVIFLKMIQEKFGIDSKYIRVVNNINQLTRVKNACNIAPLEGRRWLIIFDCDNAKNPENSIAQNSVQKALNRISSVGYDTTLVIYKTAIYGHYRRLCECAFNKPLGRYAVNLFGGRISLKAIEAIAGYYGLDVSKYDKLMKFLSQKYSRCPEELCTLFTNIKAGYQINCDQDIINLIGLGDITIADFILNILLSQPKNIKSRKRVLKTRLIYLDNLATELGYSSIQNLILDTLDGFIDIKNSIIAGELHISNTGFTAPDYYNPKRAARFNRLLRYFGLLKTSISLEYLLQARLLFRRNKYNPQLAVISWVLDMYSFIGVRDSDEIIHNQRLDFRKPAIEFSLSNYTVYGELISNKPKPITRATKPKTEPQPILDDNNTPDLMDLLRDMLALDCISDTDFLSIQEAQGGTTE